MKANALVDGGICGFHSKVLAESRDEQMVQLRITSGCEKIKELGKATEALGTVDAYAEINPAGERLIMRIVREHLKGCCAGCAVPVGIFKAMQVAAEVALPKDVTLKITVE